MLRVQESMPVQSLVCRLDDWARGSAYPRNHHDSFMDDLALGDLWS